MLFEMSIKGIGLEVEKKLPVVILKNEDGPGLLPLVVSKAEVRAIMLALNQVEPPRPISYDLLRSMLFEMEVELAEVVIHKIHENTFYTRLELRRGDDSFVLDSRPSDALAVALRTESPIYCTEEVAARAFVQKAAEGREEFERERKKFREFLDDLHPDDFRDTNED